MYGEDRKSLNAVRSSWDWTSWVRRRVLISKGDGDGSGIVIISWASDRFEMAEDMTALTISASGSVGAGKHDFNSPILRRLGGDIGQPVM